MRNFRNEIAPSLDRQYDPAPAAGRTESWWHRSRTSLFSLFRLSPVPAFGGAVLAVVLLAVTGWLLLRKQSEQHPSEEIAAAPAATPQPSAVPSPVPSLHVPAVLVTQLTAR